MTPLSIIIIITILILGIWIRQGYKAKSNEIEKQKKEKERLKEQERINFLKEKEEAEKAVELKQKIEKTINTYSLNKNQEILLNAEKDFGKLLEKNQDLIINIKREYIQDFIKISNYLKTKKANIDSVFNSINHSKNIEELDYLNNLIKTQIHTYNTILFHSINMITSLVKNNMVVFYEIYEQFDKLDIFNSNWEKIISQKLEKIEDKLDSITSEISDLNYMTQESLDNLSQQVSLQLESIDSSIKFNNLLSSVQTFQLNKIKTNTKRLS
tara:strand:+ start:878 stop:1687 length:810 start_codon:yes stop_codon:yes gene_type:complete